LNSLAWRNLPQVTIPNQSLELQYYEENKVFPPDIFFDKFYSVRIARLTSDMGRERTKSSKLIKIWKEYVSKSFDTLHLSLLLTVIYCRHNLLLTETFNKRDSIYYNSDINCSSLYLNNYSEALQLARLTKYD
jgi:hypothetical protein